jgi:hypothetical protein
MGRMGRMRKILLAAPDSGAAAPIIFCILSILHILSKPFRSSSSSSR